MINKSRFSRSFFSCKHQYFREFLFFIKLLQEYKIFFEPNKLVEFLSQKRRINHLILRNLFTILKILFSKDLSF